MFKTYIDISRRDYIYYMVHDIITMHNGWDIITTVTRPDYIRIYFSYKWFQYGEVRELKKAVKNYAKRVTYYDRTSIPKYLFAQETRPSSEEFEKAITRLDNAGIQGNPEGEIVEYIIGENIEYIVGKNRDTIRCKISVHKNLRRN